MAHSKPDPEFNPYSAPESDFERVSDSEESASLGTLGGPNYAKFSQRLYAFLLDGLILYGLMWLANIGMAILMIAILAWDSDAPFMGANSDVIFMILPFLYFVLQEGSSHQATIGKRIMGIKVTNLEGGRIGFGQSTGRFLCKIPSAVLFFLGFLMQPFTAKKQAFHDILAETLVVNTQG